MSCKDTAKQAEQKGEVEAVLTCPETQCEREAAFVGFTQEFLRHKMPPVVFEIDRRMRAAGATGVYAVGGVNRDLYIAFLEGKGWEAVDNDDVDLEVHGLPMAKVTEVLQSFGYRLATEAQSFVVNKLFYKGNGSQEHIDVAIPREDRYVPKLKCRACGETFRYTEVEARQREEHLCPACGKRALKNLGRQDCIEAVGHPTMTRAEAARRRDFPMNAMMLNIADGVVYDEYGGKEDIEAGVIRAVSEETFPEDELRFMRAPRQATTTRFRIHPDLISLARQYREKRAFVSPARMFGEWQKMLEKGKEFRHAFSFLHESGWGEFSNPQEVLGNCERVDAYLAELRERGEAFPIPLSTERLAQSGKDGEIWVTNSHHRMVFVAALLLHGEDEGSFERNTACPIKDVADSYRCLHRALSYSQVRRENVLHILKALGGRYTWQEYQTARRILGLPEPSQEALSLAERYDYAQPRPFIDGIELKERLNASGIHMGNGAWFLPPKGSKAAPARVIQRDGRLYIHPAYFGSISKELFEAQLDGAITHPDEARRLADDIIRNIYARTAGAD